MDPDLRIFCMPPSASPDCRRIWIEAALPDYATLTEIRMAMDTWLRHFCEIDFSIPDRPFVRWRTSTGTRHECYVDTFMRWLLCACKELPRPPAPPFEVPVVAVEEEDKLEQNTIVNEPIYSIAEEDIEKILRGDDEDDQ
jgi:hypothetical protein